MHEQFANKIREEKTWHWIQLFLQIQVQEDGQTA